MEFKESNLLILYEINKLARSKSWKLKNTHNRTPKDHYLIISFLAFNNLSKHIKSIILIITSLLCACTDDIKLEIPDSEQPIVFDAIITIKDTALYSNISFIRITRGSNYSSSQLSNKPYNFVSTSPYTLINPISNAQVKLISEEGDNYEMRGTTTATEEEELLFSGKEGWYFIENIHLKAHHSYRIEATINNKTYRSSYQKVNDPVAIDSTSNKSYNYLAEHGYLFNLSIIRTDGHNPDYLASSFTDPIEEGNFYTWIHQWIQPRDNENHER